MESNENRTGNSVTGDGTTARLTAGERRALRDLGWDPDRIRARRPHHMHHRFLPELHHDDILTPPDLLDSDDEHALTVFVDLRDML